MKSNIFKYLFIVFVILIVIVAVFIIKKNEKKGETKEETTSSESKEVVREIKLGMAQCDTLNPLLTKNKNVQEITRLVYEPLVDISSDYKATPVLAKEWAKQDDTTYIIKLRENVKWSNGDKFTSADVQFTCDKLKENNSIYSNNVAHINNIEIVDDYTLKIYLNQEVPFFEYYLNFPILSKTFYDTQDYNNTSIVPIGTGKYKVDNIQANFITFTQNTNWWDRETKLSLEKISINVYESIGELYNAFKLGNVDIITTDNSNIQEYIGTIGYSTKEFKGRQHDFIAFNTQNELLGKQEVRKAISYAIDKNNIVSNVFQNKYYTSNFPLDYGSWVYQDKNSSEGYNPEQTNQLLTENGWSYKNSYWQKTENYKTKKLEFNCIVKASNSQQISVAQNIKTQLANQGIIINIQQYSDEQYNIAINSKSYDMILCGINLSPNPDMSIFFGDNNLANYYTDESSDLMKEIKNTTDDAKIKEDYSKLAEIYRNDIPYISLYNNKHTVAYNTSLAGEIKSNWYNSLCGIETWYK